MNTQSRLFALAVTLLVPSIAASQEPPRTLTQWLVGGGPRLAPGARSASPVYLLGVQIKSGQSKIAWRFAAESWEEQRYGSGDQFTATPGWSESRTFGLQALGVRTFRQGRVQPYLFAGIGLYSERRNAVIGSLVAGDSGIVLGPASLVRSKEIEPTMLWGSGFNVRLMRMNLFGEARLPLYSGSGFIRARAAPLVFGFRF